MKMIDITGMRFGNLTAIEFAGRKTRPSGNKYVCWKCKCDCGNITIVDGEELRKGRTKSCGCQWHKTGKDGVRYKHGETKSRLYKIWSNMKYRCYNSHSRSYKHYGGRGIEVCEEWKNDYQAFRDWAIENGYDSEAPMGQCTIDRINVNGNYEPDNCRWISDKEQQRNRTNNVLIEYKGKVQTASQWAEQFGTSKECFYAHLKRGQSMEHIESHFMNHSSKGA